MLFSHVLEHLIKRAPLAAMTRMLLERSLDTVSKIPASLHTFYWFVGIRNDRVESLWPITARGPGY
jgi:hypothetical protein